MLSLSTLSTLSPSLKAGLLLRALRNVRMRALYSPDQERDEQGQWTDGGGGGTARVDADGGGILLDKKGKEYKIAKVSTMMSTGRGINKVSIVKYIVYANDELPESNETNLRKGEAARVALDVSKKYSISTEVHEILRRRGIASALYKHIKKDLGYSLVKSGWVSPAGEAFSKSRGLSAHPESAIHRIADASYRPVMLAVSASFMRGKKAYRSGGIDAAVKTIRASLRETLPAPLQACYKAGGQSGLDSLARKRLRHKAAEGVLRAAKDEKKRKAIFNMRFDVPNTRAAKWARERATELADDLSETSRERIKTAVANAHEAGDLRKSYDAILEAVGSEARADVISRTETMRAANEGNRAGWDEAVEKGLLSSDDRVMWIATETAACEICAEMDGKTRALTDEDYDGVEAPPTHPNCRCTEGIA